MRYGWLTFVVLFIGMASAFAVEELRVTEEGRTFVYEVHSNTEVVPLMTAMTSEEEVILAEWRASKDLAERGGFPRLVQHDNVAILQPIRKARAEAMGLTPVPEDELALWRRWLPTAYRTDIERDTRFNPELRPWGEYAFDPIPRSIRKTIATMREQEYFEVLEIRTPEEIKYHVHCPILLGWIGKNAYMLARWAESDESLLTIENVRDGLAAREQYGGWNGLFWIAAIIGGIVAWVAGLFLMNSDLNGKEQLFALSVIAVCIGIPVWIWYIQVSIQNQFPYAFS